MESKYEEIIGELREKIEKLINLYEEEREKNVELISKNNELSDKLNEKELEYKAAQTKYDNLRLAKTVVATGDDSHEAKIKINRIVREIDKCIALLNK
jgi:hypothetical protein